MRTYVYFFLLKIHRKIKIVKVTRFHVFLKHTTESSLSQLFHFSILIIAISVIEQNKDSIAGVSPDHLGAWLLLLLGLYNILNYSIHISYQFKNILIFQQLSI